MCALPFIIFGVAGLLVLSLPITFVVAFLWQFVIERNQRVPVEPIVQEYPPVRKVTAEEIFELVKDFVVVPKWTPPTKPCKMFDFKDDWESLMILRGKIRNRQPLW